MLSRIILEPHRLLDDTLEVAATYHPAHQPGKTHRLWWRSAAWKNAVTTHADPFLIAFLFPLMQDRADVFIEAPVSPSLLQNLETFMAVWHTWYPQLYHPVPIRAAAEIEPPPPPLPGQTIIPFSCGLDSCFTAFRHKRHLLDRRSRNITAAVVMHGFNIHLHQPNADAIYASLLAAARPLLASLDIDCIPLATNFHDLPTDWNHSHGAHLAAALALFAPQFDSALIPNSVTYAYLARYWGTHPFTDPFFSSRRFPILDDGGDAIRCQKAQLLAQWPQAMQLLRVCYSDPLTHSNCCRCEKCATTLLEFRVAGVPRPASFPTDITDRQLARVRMQKELFHFARASLAAAIQEHHLHKTSWAKAYHAALRRNQFRHRLRALQRPFIPLRNRLRRLFRGSPLSKKQRAQLPPPTIPPQ